MTSEGLGEVFEGEICMGPMLSKILRSRAVAARKAMISLITTVKKFELMEMINNNTTHV